MSYNYDYSTMYSSADAQAGIIGAILGASLFVIVLALAIAALMVVIMWKIFQKAGKEGWIALIPGYNAYTLFEITWGCGWYFLLLFLGVIPLVGSIAVLVIGIMTYVKLAKAFGKDGGFAVGLIFLNIIFMAILAFDNSTYLGVADSKDNSYSQRPVDQGISNVADNGDKQDVINTSKYCTNCGNPLGSNDMFCTKCGTKRTN